MSTLVRREKESSRCGGGDGVRSSGIGGGGGRSLSLL